MLLILLLPHTGLLPPVMTASGVFSGFLWAPVLCLFCLVDSVQLSGPEVVNAAYGGSVTVSCQYDKRFKEYTKYWCKGKVYDLCTIVVKTPRNRPSDRSSITDNKEAGVFTVTMTSLREGDEGMYWCVVSRHGKNNRNGVMLRISHTVTTTIPTTIPTTSPVTQEEISLNSIWAGVRWVLLIFMLCCLVSTHVLAWRIKKKMWNHQQFKYRNSNTYN